MEEVKVNKAVKPHLSSEKDDIRPTSLKRKSLEDVEHNLNEPVSKRPRTEPPEIKTAPALSVPLPENEATSPKDIADTSKEQSNKYQKVAVSENNTLDTLSSHVSDWTSCHLEHILQTFKITHSVVKHEAIMVPFSKVEVPEVVSSHINSLKDAFEPLDCALETLPSEESKQKFDPLKIQESFNTIAQSLQDLKASGTISDKRFGKPSSFLKDLKIWFEDLDEMTESHIKVMAHSFLQMTGLHVRSGYDYTSKEKIFDTTYISEPDMRVYTENHVMLKEPRIIAIIKVRKDSGESHLPSQEVLAQLTGELLLDFRRAKFPNELFAFAVHGTTVWLLCLQRCPDTITETSRYRVLVDHEYRWKSFIDSDKDLLISEPLNYLVRSDRQKLFTIFSKFVSVASTRPTPPIRQKLL